MLKCIIMSTIDSEDSSENEFPDINKVVEGIIWWYGKCSLSYSLLLHTGSKISYPSRSGNGHSGNIDDLSVLNWTLNLSLGTGDLAKKLTPEIPQGTILNIFCICNRYDKLLCLSCAQNSWTSRSMYHRST